ncbi:MAG: hypothetical protein HGA31_05970 [Candidatus Moranbacteria bacterium]|nr:hypothetical protein [Candidatus Moranbacteria bacterium]
MNKTETDESVNEAHPVRSGLLPGGTDSEDEQFRLQLFGVRKVEVTWMLERQMAEVDRIEFNVGLGKKGIRDNSFCHFCGRVAYVISKIRRRKRTVSACTATTHANLSLHEKLFANVERAIRSDDVILKELSSELNVWLRQKLGTDRVLNLKTEKMRAMMSAGDDGAYDMLIRQTEGPSGSESFHLMMAERLLRQIFLSRHLHSTLTMMTAENESEIRPIADDIRRMIRERSNDRVMLPKAILHSVNERIEEFETLSSLVVEGEDIGHYDELFEELCDIRRQLIWIASDVRKKFPATR